MKKSLPTSVKDTFSQNIGMVRRIKNLSQERLAEMANRHRTYIGQIERGDVTPTQDAAERVAQALGLELWELLQPGFSLDAVIKQER